MPTDPRTVEPHPFTPGANFDLAGQQCAECGWYEATQPPHGSTLVAHQHKVVGRWRACLKAWPECEDGAYDPRCCRFPKVCSCDVHDYVNYDPRYVVLFQGGGQEGESDG